VAEAGNIAESEMLRTFNCGVGMVAVVAADKVEAVRTALLGEGEKAVVLGELTAWSGDGERVATRGRLFR